MRKTVYLGDLLQSAWPRMMIENEVLKAIRERRSILIFRPEPLEDEKIEAVLDAGRWAPSFGNSQPWEFIVVKDQFRREKLSDLTARVSIIHKGIRGAPVIIVVCVDPRKDSSHFIEDGAVATQNMALAAHSLGLASYWVGIFNPRDEKGSIEREVKKFLNIPNEYRVIAFLPIGIRAYDPPTQTRKSLREITHYDQHGSRPTDTV